MVLKIVKGLTPLETEMPNVTQYTTYDAGGHWHKVFCHLKLAECLMRHCQGCN